MTTLTVDSPDFPGREPGPAERTWVGDRRAFETIFRTHYPALAEYAQSLVGSPDAAEQVVQDVFVTLWAHRGQLTTPRNLPAYLLRAVRKRAINHLRHRRMDTVRQVQAAPPGTPEALSADREVDGAELARAIRDATATLSPRCRRVFELCREGRLTYPQIAQRLGIPVKTVETLMGRALTAVRLRLAAPTV
jgi:RNA polymerase sigma-70 factor (ECF subfamily)